jgi:nucleotide-binding universal stress UspA family protein
MTPLKQLLAATDLSGPSLKAVDRALSLAAGHGAHCTVVHALGVDALQPLRELLGAKVADLTQAAEARQSQALNAALSGLAARHGVAPDVRIERGFATEAIPACADAVGADLVVVGAHGQGFVQRVLVGSTSSALLRKSRQPVLVVKRSVHQSYRRILIPVIAQYRVEARQRALGQLHALATACDLRPTDYTGLVLHGSASRQILSQARHFGCDLIAIGKHGTHVTEELLLGSVTKRILAEASSDVLVVLDPRHPASGLPSEADGR